MGYIEKLKDLKLKGRSGIYKLNINGRFYIGSAVDLEKRLREHLYSLTKNNHTNIHVQRAFNKYGEINFNILEFEAIGKLINREQYYIDVLKPTLNISLTAGSQLGFKHSEETKTKMSKTRLGKKHSEERKTNRSEMLKSTQQMSGEVGGQISRAVLYVGLRFARYRYSA